MCHIIIIIMNVLKLTNLNVMFNARAKPGRAAINQ